MFYEWYVPKIVTKRSKESSTQWSWIFFIKRLLRLKWFESLLVSFLAWKNRFAIWLVKSKRTNYTLVFRQGSNVWKSSTVGPIVELKKQRRVAYHLKALSKKVWSDYMNHDWTQLQVQLKGNLNILESGTDSILKTYGYAHRRLKYGLYGFRWWYKRAMRQLKRRVRYKMRNQMRKYFKRSLAVLYSKPFVVLNKKKKNLESLLRNKWLEEKLRTPKERRELLMKLQRKWILRYKDKKKKTWYFYHTEIQSSLRSGVMIHSLADYTSHPFGGKRYRRRNIIR